MSNINIVKPTADFEFDKFILLTVYTPNSQSGDSERFKYRSEVWDDVFRDY